MLLIKKTYEATDRSNPHTNQDKRSCPHNDRFHKPIRINDPAHITIDSTYQSVNLIDRSTLVYTYTGPRALPVPRVGRPGPGSSTRPPGSSTRPLVQIFRSLAPFSDLQSPIPASMVRFPSQSWKNGIPKSQCWKSIGKIKEMM